MGRALELIRRLETNVGRALVGKPEVVRLAVIGLVARGHLLIEDVPGVGKTTLAAALARSIGAGFQRIQFTSDMLPSDILGVSVWQPERSAFVFKPGPLFTNIVLADEINRTTPKTQSSLLEAMNETQVSLDHSTYQLPRPFMVLAWALADGRDYLVPDDVKTLAVPALAHRVLVRGATGRPRDGGVDAESVIRAIAHEVPVPR